MALAESAYRLDTYSDLVPESSPTRIRAERTGQRAENSSSSMLVTAAKMAVILLFVVAVLAFARITLTNATVTTMIESDALSSEISEARSSGISLEMEQSVLSNNYAVDAAAKRLGMAAPGEVGTIALSPDIVSVDQDGALSLSGSVSSLVKAQG